MSKKFKFLKKLSLIFVISLLVSSCGSADDAVSTALDSPKSNADFYAGPIGESEKNLNILVWPGYAEDGSTVAQKMIIFTPYLHSLTEAIKVQHE